MRLLSADQPSVDLSVARYQFPDLQVESERDWDANWLQVTGIVVLADGQTWTFDEACLTTWEAADLGQWLHDVAAGLVQPPPLGAEGPEKIKMFTEPNIAFSLEGRADERVHLRVHFSLECLPSWARGDAEPEVWDYFVVLDLPDAELARQAEAWIEDLSPFPAR